MLCTSLSQEVESLCIQLGKNGTNGSAIISTYPHRCDSGRFQKTEKSANNFKASELPLETKLQEEALENTDISKLSLPMQTIPFSINNKPTTTENIYQETLLTEKISFPPSSPILSPETVHVLENAEKLVEDAQKQILEINHNILFHKENFDMSEVQPTIDEYLLYLRQIVASRFQQANNPSKMHNTNDHRTFTNSVQQVPEKEIIKTPRLLKIMTMLPEKCILDTKDEEPYRRVPPHVKRKLLSTDSISNQLHTSDKIQNESPATLIGKADQTDENGNKPASSILQIQTGPKVIIKRSLQIQNVEPLHISPESSIKEPINVGIYKFHHETFSEKSDLSEEPFSNENDREDQQILEKRNAERKQIFRKSVVIKKSDDSKNKISFKEDSEKFAEKKPETNSFSGTNIEGSYQSTNKDKLISQSPRETTTTNSTKSPKQCNIENAKAKAYTEFLSNLERNLDYSVTSKKLEDTEEIGEKIKITSHKNRELPNKVTIISNERVNLRYKDILRGSKVNPKISNPSFLQLDQSFDDSEIEIDNINLKQPCVLDLDNILKRNDEIIDSVIHDTTLLKTMSSIFETHNNVINQEENKKVSHKVEFASVQNLKLPGKNEGIIKSEHIKSSIEKYSVEKENDFKFNEISDKVLDSIVSDTNKLTKFISSGSEVNDSVINQESVINSQSLNLSTTSVSLMSSTKNLISQKPLSSEIKESSSVSSEDQSANELKDLSTKYFSAERKAADDLSIELKSEKSSKSVFEEKKEKENDKTVEEEKFSKILLMQNNRFDNSERREDTESPQILKESSNTESNLSEALALKPPSNSDLSSNIHSINYCRSSLQIKENDYSEMEIFGFIFESLRHSSAAIKRFITCLFGETEARVENEIIGILKEMDVHPTIINQFLSILQKRDKDSQLSIFTTNVGLYLNLNDRSRENNSLRNQFKDFLEGKTKTVSLYSETNRKLDNDNASNQNENNDKKSIQIRLDLDVTTENKKDIYDDPSSTVTQEKIDLTKSQENKEHFVQKLNEDFSLENLTNVEKVLDKKNKNDVNNESDRNSGDNSPQLIIQEQLGNLNKVEVRTNSPSEIKSIIDSGPSISESSKRIDYSQNFTDSSSTSKDCKSLESHLSLKLNDSFMNKKEGLINKETAAERSDELEIQRKIDDLLDREKRVTQSVEESIKTEINNLTKERNSEKNAKQKISIGGKTFVMKNPNLGLSVKTPETNDNVVNSSTFNSQKGSNLRTSSGTLESNGKNAESSSETYSEGEVYLPSSCSYSLGEIRGSQQENISIRKASDTNSSKTDCSSKKQNSSSSITNNSLTRSLGEVYDSLM